MHLGDLQEQEDADPTDTYITLVHTLITTYIDI